MVFNIQRKEILLAQIQDTGVPGATLTVTMHGKHCFFALKSPHAAMTLINSRPEDIRKLRAGLKLAEQVFNETAEAEDSEKRRLSRSQTDSRVADHKRKENKKEKRNSETPDGDKGHDKKRKNKS